MKNDRFSAVAAFFRRGGSKSAPSAPPGNSEEARLVRLSGETGVPVRALSLFSKISESKDFTAEAAHKDFGRVKLKEVA